MWREALAAKYDGRGSFGPEQWDALLGHCQAVTDWPACVFAPELMATYPDAKVLLTTRDPDEWHASAMRTVDWRVTQDWQYLLLGWLGSWCVATHRPMVVKFWKEYFGGDFGGNGKEVFARHNDMVRRLAETSGAAAEGRFLEYDVRQGWGPLCEFLDCPVPDEPFPHSNDTADFKKMCRRRNRAQFGNIVAGAIPWVAGLAVSVSLLRWGRRFVWP
jgi:hypothetical protein